MSCVRSVATLDQERPLWRESSYSARGFWLTSLPWFHAINDLGGHVNFATRLYDPPSSMLSFSPSPAPAVPTTGTFLFEYPQR